MLAEALRWDVEYFLKKVASHVHGELPEKLGSFLSLQHLAPLKFILFLETQPRLRLSKQVLRELLAKFGWI